jgi:hypothetical protein
LTWIKERVAPPGEDVHPLQRRSETMSVGEIAILVLIVGAFTVFGVTLAWLSRTPREQVTRSAADTPHSRRAA